MLGDERSPPNRDIYHHDLQYPLNVDCGRLLMSSH
jgi:hypothetical protein